MFLSSLCDEIKIIPVHDYDSHYLILRLDENLTVSVLEHSLPESEKYFKPVGRIEMFSATFFHLLDQMERFYAQISIIDELTCVVDPEVITTKHNHRVIRLGKFTHCKFILCLLS